VLVHLSGEAPSAVDPYVSPRSPQASAREQLVDRPITDVVVPFRVSDEPLVPVAPYLAIAVIAGAALLGLIFLFF
jgi:hypothetical protein